MLERVSSHPLEGLEPLVDEEPCGFPDAPHFSSFCERELTRFLAAYKGDEKKAMKRLHAAVRLVIHRLLTL